MKGISPTFAKMALKMKKRVSLSTLWMTEQPLKVGPNAMVFCGVRVGKNVLLGQTPCVALAGAEKKRTEILIKIVASAIKSDRGESEQFLHCPFFFIYKGFN